MDLHVEKGEILALLGPNGAGKTTLIASICGLLRPTSGHIHVGGYDVKTQYREARKLIGLVPQEISLDQFESVINTLRFSRGLFGLPPDDMFLKQILKQLSLWEKRQSRIKELSGGMRRRVMIAKALVHQPRILFLDEPTAGVDVELRQDMWELIRHLKEDGVTIILTTHYIAEAEAIADRIAVINKGKIMLIEDKAALLQRMARKTLIVDLEAPVRQPPKVLARYRLNLAKGGYALEFDYGSYTASTTIAALLTDLTKAGLKIRDVETKQSNLENIILNLLQNEIS